MTPPANRLLPPDSASEAHSSTTTPAPCSRAERAAQSAALPAPTTMTSCSGLSIAGLGLERLDLHLAPLDGAAGRVVGAVAELEGERPLRELGVLDVSGLDAV